MKFSFRIFDITINATFWETIINSHSKLTLMHTLLKIVIELHIIWGTTYIFHHNIGIQAYLQNDITLCIPL